MDGGTQVLVFILSFAVLGASGSEHKFPGYCKLSRPNNCAKEMSRGGPMASAQHEKHTITCQHLLTSSLSQGETTGKRYSL
jgi:hypothetical protein